MIKTKLTLLNILFLGLITPCFSATASSIQIIPEIKHDLYFPFDQSIKLSNAGGKINSSNLPTNNKIPNEAFVGIGEGLGDYKVTTLNPNVNGSVGLTQYVQVVNYAIGIFDKNTGKIYSGFPKASNVLWKGFGGQCESEIGKYAIVKYDQLAKRWVITHTTSSSLCIAVSTSDNALGSYYRYGYNLKAWPVNARFGLWPSAYYMSFNLRDKTNYIDNLICGLDRNKMLVGGTAAAQCMIMPRHFNTLVNVAPIDLEGTMLPFNDNKSPGFFWATYKEWFNSSALFFRFHVDFDNPANSNMSSFTTAWNDSAALPMRMAKQPNNIDLIVDNNGMNVNHRVIFRAFLESDIVPMGLISGCSTAYTKENGLTEYWFQMSLDESGYIVLDRGVLFGNENADRYSGSVAMNKTLNLMMTNNVSSSAIYPSIELHYPITQPGEIIVNGQGSQNASPVNKWGDYSSASVDPVDDCTIWSTHAYLKNTGNYNWSTAILKIKFPDCA